MHPTDVVVESSGTLQWSWKFFRRTDKNKEQCWWRRAEAVAVRGGAGGQQCDVHRSSASRFSSRCCALVLVVFVARRANEGMRWTSGVASVWQVVGHWGIRQVQLRSFWIGL